MSIVAPIAQSILDIPFNDVEMYHSRNGQGTIERGGNCIFLMNTFLERLKVIDPDLQVTVLEARELIHYATQLQMDGEEYFFDPFLRTDDVCPLPAEVGQRSPIVPAHPQDVNFRLEYFVDRRVKRRKEIIAVNRRMFKDGEMRESTPYTYQVQSSTKMIPEIDVTYERKNNLDIAILENINGVRRLYRLVFVLRGLNYFVCNNSGGEVGNIRDEPAVFYDNLGPIAARFKMQPNELLDYVRYGVAERAKLRMEKLGVT